MGFKLTFFRLFALWSNKVGAALTEDEIEFQVTNPIPRYTTYSEKLLTLNTAPYTVAKTATDNKLEIPSQKLPRVVLANLERLLAVAVNHQAFLVVIANMTDLMTGVMVKIN